MMIHGDKLPYATQLQPAAQQLRRNMTQDEKHLWYDYLRSYPVQFKRQKPIGIYIADFYCPQASLVIELDGKQHNHPEQAKWDEERTAYMQSVGLEVVRFSNKDIREHFSEVCLWIDMHIRERMKKKEERE